jgi:hypothetical protein
MATTLTLVKYRTELEKLWRQFDFARFALKGISTTRKRAFFKEEYQREISKFEAMGNASAEAKEPFEKAGIDFDKIAASILEHSKAHYRKELRPKNHRVYEEGIEDGLRQSELLLLVAYFEEFLKAFHRTLLCADAQRLFEERADNKGKIQMKLKVEDIFQGSMDDVRRALIEKEINDLDREKIEERVKHFQQSFGVSIGESKTVERLQHFMELRNDITHHILDPERIRIPNDAEIKEARDLFYWAASSLWYSASQKYPKHFR